MRRTVCALAAFTALAGAGCSGHGASPTTKTSLLPGVERVGVPATLQAKIPSLELSGIAWAPSLQRYLVVTDDTAPPGTGPREKHRPIVLAMSQDGALDDTLVPIEGVDDLNDPESIAAGPDGTFFIATSHSLNKSGHVPTNRRKLLLVRLVARALRVLGQIDLTTLAATEGHALLETARLEPGGDLDIEGLAFHEGALYIGLKAPLAIDGGATIVRLADAAASLAAGRVAPGALRFWSRVKLCRPHHDADVCEGIADLTFLSDGSLLVLGNSPKDLASDGGGALWRLAGPGQAPAFVKDYPGMKPEGISLTPDGAAAVIVFDTDGAPPRWTHWKL